MPAVYTRKLRSLTADGSTTIATIDVTIDSDGFLRTAGLELQINGDVGKLISLLFDAANGVDQGSSGVQGHRIFGQPEIIQ